MNVSLSFSNETSSLNSLSILAFRRSSSYDISIQSTHEPYCVDRTDLYGGTLAVFGGVEYHTSVFDLLHVGPSLDRPSTVGRSLMPGLISDDLGSFVLLFHPGQQDVI